MEDVILADADVERYVQHLEEGLIAPTLLLPWDPDRSSGGPFYQLVWKDVILREGKKFFEYVDDLGMSVCEPVDDMVVTME